MSHLLIMEVAMKKEAPELYDIYFGGHVLIHYEKRIPFVVVGIREGISKSGAEELMCNCPRLKEFHKALFDVELKSFLVTEEQFLRVDNWWKYFHPNGVYR